MFLHEAASRFPSTVNELVTSLPAPVLRCCTRQLAFYLHAKAPHIKCQRLHLDKTPIMNPSGFPQYRGMQVHAVPDSDRAFDSATGRKLPWAYDLNPAAAPGQRDPVEKGPFGRGTNRRTRSTLSRSRSKTAEPKREEDRIRAEQLAAEDAVFGSLRRVTRDTGVGGEDGEAQKAATRTAGSQVQGGASEVILYGFGVDMQWSAIEFYEKVSGGDILEDYSRLPPWGNDYLACQGNSPHPKGIRTRRKLDVEELKMKNNYAGGLHWIKVTFDSKSAAELACARSPHVIRGYLVYAEQYQQRGPGRDEPIPATQAGAQIMGIDVPSSFSTRALRPVDTSPGGSSTTATSATATAARANGGSRTSSTHTLDNIFAPQNFTRQQQQEQPSLLRTPTAPQPVDPDTQLQPQPAGQETLRRRRISGAKIAQVHPASMALAPKKAKQSWSAWLLGTGDVIGSTVPKKEDGSFDWDKAGFYWRLFFWLDGVLGTDFCGLKAD